MFNFLYAKPRTWYALTSLKKGFKVLYMLDKWKCYILYNKEWKWIWGVLCVEILRISRHHVHNSVTITNEYEQEKNTEHTVDVHYYLQLYKNLSNQ